MIRPALVTTRSSFTTAASAMVINSIAASVAKVKVLDDGAGLQKNGGGI